MSDIHFSATDPNPLSSRTEAIIGALREATLTSDACFLVLNGDTADKGHEDEYKYATQFLTTLCDSLSQDHNHMPLAILSVPGNHDCDLSSHTQVRDLLVANPPRSPDSSVVNACLEVQTPYRVFENSLPSFSRGFTAPPERVDHSMLHHEYVFTLGSDHLSFHLLNSSWLSRLHEQPGTLYLPVSDTTPHMRGESHTHISVLHHPYSWLEPNNALAIREYLQSYSDVIMTGHMHRQAAYSVLQATGERNEYIEGSVLQDEDESRSGFNVIHLDLSTFELSVDTYSLNGSEHYELASRTPPQPFHRQKRRVGTQFVHTDAFRGFLEDVGATYHYGGRRPLRLSSMFVYPFLRDISKFADEPSLSMVRQRELISLVQLTPCTLITGSNKCGKTALAKTITTDLLKNARVPLHLSGTHVKSADAKKLRSLYDRLVEEQYGKDTSLRFWQLKREERVAVVDDYHLVRLNRKLRNEFILNLQQHFGIVVFLSTDQAILDELTADESVPSVLSQFRHLQLLEFGYLLRHELIRRWYTLNITDEVDDEELERKISEAERLVSSSLRHDFVPSFPIFVLILLHTIDTPHREQSSNGSFGYLYEVLVNTALLSSSSTIASIDTKHNYLAHLAFDMHTSQEEHWKDARVEDWHRQHCESFAHKLDYARMRNDLAGCGILECDDGEVWFKYKYVQLYFVAECIAKNIGDERMRAYIRALIDSVYFEDNASIIICLCHTSKDPFVINEIIARSTQLFAGVAEVDFETDTKFIGDISNLIPNRVFESAKREERRRLMLERQEQVHAEACASHVLVQPQDERFSKAMDLSTNMNSAFAMVQILGQVLKNFGGSMRAERKLEVAHECYRVGLRATRAMFDFISENQDIVVERYIAGARMSRANDPRAIDKYRSINDVIEMDVKNKLLSLIESVALGTICHISSSVGMQELEKTFEQMVRDSNTPAYRLIDLAVRLDNFTVFPSTEVRDIGKDFKDKFFPMMLARDLVWYHLHLFKVKYRIKQEACERLDIKLLGSEFNEKLKKDL
ncbi:MAG: hypothetical protein KF838_13810 [Phycisphaeraceae bacterium]|nr:MAG: hypothetical protein KF838_13810 [Phycisphaeraceae bacterium]